MSSGTFDLGINADSQPQVVAGQPGIEQVCDEIFVRFLSDVENRLQGADDEGARQALEELFLTLRDRKRSQTEVEWRETVAACRSHSVVKLLHQDPFTFRAFSKPRGYAGDACMMDFIYGREEGWQAPPAEPIGQRVFQFTTAAPASDGVRSRRAEIASTIDRLSEERSRPHILAIASGHLREANLSIAIRRQRTGRIVALDADAQSLVEVQDAYGRFGVETVAASFRNLLTSNSRSGQFDLVYSTGLFDYLAQNTGRRLVEAMFDALRPGGSLMVANFLPDVRDIGYMEAFMDWNLIYRSRHDMVDLTAEIPEAEIHDVRVWSEEAQNIIFLRVTRK